MLLLGMLAVLIILILCLDNTAPHKGKKATGQNSQNPIPDQHDGDGHPVITPNPVGSGLTFHDFPPAQPPPSSYLPNRASGSSGRVARLLNSMARRVNNRPSPYAQLPAVVHYHPHPLTVNDQEQDRSTYAVSTSNAQNHPPALDIEGSLNFVPPPGCSPQNCVACSSDRAWCLHFNCSWVDRLAACY